MGAPIKVTPAGKAKVDNASPRPLRYYLSASSSAKDKPTSFPIRQLRLADWTPRAESWAVFVIVFLLGLAVGRPSIHGHDGILHYVYLRSAVFDGDLDFTNDYEYFDSLTEGDYELSAKPRHPATGRPSNYYGVGAAMLWSPIYLAGYGLKWAASPSRDETGRPLSLERNDYSAWLIGVGSLFWGALGLALLYRLGRQFCSRAQTLTALGLLWLASPLPCYLHFHPSMSHACAFFAASLLVYLYFSAPSPSSQLRWIGIGAAGGLVLTIRHQDAFLLLIPALGELVDLMRRGGARWNSGDAISGPDGARSRPDNLQRRRLLERLPNYAAALGALLLVLLPQQLAWRALYGSAFSGPWHYLAIDSLHLTRPVHFFQIFFSSRHGLFFWHPLLLAGLIGLVWRFKRGTTDGAPGPWRAILLIVFILHAYLIACWDFWYAGASFGHRMFISMLPVLFLGALSLQQTLCQNRRRTALAVAVLLFFSFWNAGLLIQYREEMISREEAVSFKELVTNQFTRVPKFIWTEGVRLLLKRETVK